MKDAPNVAEKACGALYFLAQGYEDADPCPLTPYFQDIAQSLLTASHREDVGKSRLRTAACEALNEVVRCSTEETASLVLQLARVIKDELLKSLEGQRKRNRVCVVTVGVVGDICWALEAKVLPYCDWIMTELLKDLSSNQLHRSMKPSIFSCLGDIGLCLVMKTAIGVLGDLADTLGSSADSLIQQSHFCKDFLNECLSSEDDGIKESAEWAKLAITKAISV
ncbi:Importin subunit beta-1 [Linum perenne]